MPAKMKLCFDNGNVASIVRGNAVKTYNLEPIRSGVNLNTFGVQNRNNIGKQANFMNVAVLKKTKGGCGACGGR